MMYKSKEKSVHVKITGIHINLDKILYEIQVFWLIRHFTVGKRYTLVNPHLANLTSCFYEKKNPLKKIS